MEVEKYPPLKMLAKQAFALREEKTDPADLPVINEPQKMFDDLVQRTPAIEQLAEALAGRPLRVATMCSGTESPLLALEMISKACAAAFGAELPVEHVFSCEIEPYKQAYIERNFEPPVLFRDIRELSEPLATTAYGAKVRVPGATARATRATCSSRARRASTTRTSTTTRRASTSRARAARRGAA